MPENMICPRCFQPYRVGELACAHCGTVFSTFGKTRQVNASDDLPVELTSPQVKGDRVGFKAITFVIDNRPVLLPVEETIVVGRPGDQPDDPQPDVDLSAYGGGEKGISRRHLRLRYKGFEAVVEDLESTNGSWLNGERLLPRTEYLLHDGDQLRLGMLSITIRF